MANRTIKLYKDYFKEFYVTQTDAVRRKINYCINVVMPPIRRFYSIDHLLRQCAQLPAGRFNILRPEDGGNQIGRASGRERV